MKNRGLTLVELLAVLIVLGIVGLIVVPKIFKQVKDNREQMYEDQVAIIEDAARAWAVDHVDLLPNSVEAESYNITFEILQNEGYIDPNFKNVKTKEPFNPTSYVKIKCTLATDTNYSYSYTYIP